MLSSSLLSASVRRKLVAGLVGLFVLGSAGVAGAQVATQYPPTAAVLGVSDTNPAPGETITVSGSGFAPTSPVTVVLGADLLAQVTTSVQGTFAARVTIPCTAAPGPATIDARGSAPTGEARVASAAITIQEGVCPPIAGGALPRTGSTSTAPLTAAGVGLVLIGVATVVVARRRRHADALGL